MTMCPLMHHFLCKFFLQNIISSRWLSSPTDRFGAGDFWLFPKLKSPPKGKRFQTIYEIQENMMGQLMVIGRTTWGSMVPTLKGTEVSLSYVQSFLYLVSSSINVSILHITWLDTLWTGHVHIENILTVARWETGWRIGEKSKEIRSKNLEDFRPRFRHK